MFSTGRIYMTVAVVSAATFLVSCGGRKETETDMDLSLLPSQVVNDISAVQTDNGVLVYKLIAPQMKRYENAEEPYEVFEKGLTVLGYTEDGEVETRIVADKAVHKTKNRNEAWEAYGNVEVENYLKGEVMRTDTLYWDMEKKMIYTHSFVRLSSPQGYLQGYGFKSDEMARNAEILRPFDSYGYVSGDSSSIKRYADSANFIGPVLK